MLFLVKREVKKKAGYEVDIQLNEFTATVTDGTAHVHLNVDAELGKDELTKRTEQSSKSPATPNILSSASSAISMTVS